MTCRRTDCASRRLSLRDRNSRSKTTTIVIFGLILDVCTGTMLRGSGMAYESRSLEKRSDYTPATAGPACTSLSVPAAAGVLAGVYTIDGRLNAGRPVYSDTTSGNKIFAQESSKVSWYITSQSSSFFVSLDNDAYEPADIGGPEAWQRNNDPTCPLAGLCTVQLNISCATWAHGFLTVSPTTAPHPNSMNGSEGGHGTRNETLTSTPSPMITDTPTPCAGVTARATTSPTASVNASSTAEPTASPSSITTGRTVSTSSPTPGPVASSTASSTGSPTASPTPRLVATDRTLPPIIVSTSSPTASPSTGSPIISTFATEDDYDDTEWCRSIRVQQGGSRTGVYIADGTQAHSRPVYHEVLNLTDRIFSAPVNICEREWGVVNATWAGSMRNPTRDTAARDVFLHYYANNGFPAVDGCWINVWYVAAAGTANFASAVGETYLAVSEELDPTEVVQWAKYIPATESTAATIRENNRVKVGCIDTATATSSAMTQRAPASRQ